LNRGLFFERGIKMDRNPHYFWAVRLPDAVKKVIFEKLEEVKSVFPFKRWVHQEDYHITLAFLGSAPKQKLDLVTDSVKETIKKEQAFSLQIEAISTFGNKQSPRIFWASLQHEERLLQVQAVVAKQCKEAGFKLEDRKYNPHITLARQWKGLEFEPQLLQRFNPFKNEPLSFQAQEVVLYRTNLEKTPKYQSIATFSLVNE
jgi:RNA 2',3'-cyclic 3'-phosphodiesterase